MNVATAGHVSLLDSYQAELGILRTHASNLLLEGPAAATDAVLLLLRPHLREPLVRSPLRSPFELPEGTTRGLILRDVAALSADDQARLLAWLQGEGFGTQVVSMTEQPLFALVALGLFDAALYYRLNVLMLRIGATNPPRVARRRVRRPLRRREVLAALTSRDQDIHKGALEDELPSGATNAPGLDGDGLPNDETAIAEDALGATEDNTQG